MGVGHDRRLPRHGRRRRHPAAGHEQATATARAGTWPPTRTTICVAGKKPLWTTDRFVSCAHNGARLADLDGDGRDEVLGATIFSARRQAARRGRRVPRPHGQRVRGRRAARPARAGGRAVWRRGRTTCSSWASAGPIWRSDFRRQEPQNAAVGRFKPGSDEIFIWCRSRYNEHQKPFVFDSRGKKVFDYAMDDVAPAGWTASGVEVIHTIDWTGGRNQLACAKERHTEGDVCLFEPLTGRFVERIDAEGRPALRGRRDGRLARGDPRARRAIELHDLPEPGPQSPTRPEAALGEPQLPPAEAVPQLLFAVAMDRVWESWNESVR